MSDSPTEGAARTPAYPRRGKRRATHNEAERRRARRINDQITKLKDLVAEDGVIPTDKHGILTAAVDTIRDLRAQLMRSKAANTPTSLVKTSMPMAPPVDFRSVYLTMPIPATVVGVDGTFLTATKAFVDVSGIAMRDLCKFTMFSLTTPEELPAMYKMVGELMSGKSGVRFSKACQFKSHKCLVNISMRVLRENGRHVGFSCDLDTSTCTHPIHESADSWSGSNSLTDGGRSSSSTPPAAESAATPELVSSASSPTSGGHDAHVLPKDTLAFDEPVPFETEALWPESSALPLLLEMDTPKADVQPGMLGGLGGLGGVVGGGGGGGGGGTGAAPMPPVAPAPAPAPAPYGFDDRLDFAGMSMAMYGAGAPFNRHAMHPAGYMMQMRAVPGMR